MLTRSISRTEAAPIPYATARARIFTARRSRAAAVSIFESSTPGIARTSAGMTTAHATTGPARGPRPTSSTPARIGPCAAPSARSSGLQRRRPARGRPSSAMGLLRCLLGARRADLALLDARGLAREVAQVVELRAADLAAAHDDDVADHRAVHRED